MWIFWNTIPCLGLLLGDQSKDRSLQKRFERVWVSSPVMKTSSEESIDLLRMTTHDPREPKS